MKSLNEKFCTCIKNYENEILEMKELILETENFKKSIDKKNIEYENLLTIYNSLKDDYEYLKNEKVSYEQ